MLNRFKPFIPRARRCYYRLLLVIVSIFISVVPAHAKPIKVIFLNPDSEHWFWIMTTDVMAAAAKDLGISLEVIASDRDHLTNMERTKEIISRPEKPDYLITGNEKGAAAEVIRRAEQAQIRVFLFSNGFVKKREKQLMGAPGERYSHWIGQLIPDNYSAGYQMGRDLIKKTLSLKATRPIYIAAIAGTFNTHASDERVRGLKAAVAEHSNEVTLLQIIPGNWEQNKASQIAEGLLNRYPQLDAIWAVNDSTALGAINASVKRNRIPGKDIFFVGCGWHTPALAAIKSGELISSYGGHFFDGAWAMLLINDHYHGHTISQHLPDSKMTGINSGNLKRYERFLEHRLWHQIDFRRLSRHHNPELENHNFSLDAIISKGKD